MKLADGVLWKVRMACEDGCACFATKDLPELELHTSHLSPHPRSRATIHYKLNLVVKGNPCIVVNIHRTSR